MSNNKINISSELMENYLQAEIMNQSGRFEALQDANGNSIFLSIGTDNYLYAVTETHGTCASGWKKQDISTHILSQLGSGAICKSFDANQQHNSTNITLAMIVSHGGADYLYLSLNNSSQNTSWLSSPNWQIYSYDCKNPPNGQAQGGLKIANVFISEPSDGEHIMVDVLRKDNNQLIERYRVSSTKENGHNWHLHSIGIDLEVVDHRSCVGRASGDEIDALYTFGQAGGSYHLVYQPMKDPDNSMNPDSVSIAKLFLSGQSMQKIDAIATSRNTDLSTDLFCLQNKTLYYFASNNQEDQATAKSIFSNDLFTGATFLHAHQADNKVYLWGLNQAKQVFFTYCKADSVENKSDWSMPVPLLSGIQHISPYVNLKDNTNTFFAGANDSLTKMEKSTSTGVWTKQQITLPSIGAKTQTIKSYTTHIQYTDQNNQPIANKTLQVSALSRGHFYINNLYYVLDKTPIPIQTDALGVITIIEPVHSLHATKITVAESSGGTSVTANPMQNPVQRIGKLKHASDLQSAKSYTCTASGRTPIPLGCSGNLGKVAQSNQQLMTAYQSVKTNNPQSAGQTLGAGQSSNIAVEIGDLFQWLASGVVHTFEIAIHKAEGAWHFLATIGSDVYNGVINCAEHVLGAIEWIFHEIKVGIEKLIKFAEFLFEWDDIVRTKKVFHNSILRFLEHSIGELSGVKNNLDHVFAAIEAKISDWAGTSDWSGHLNKGNTLPSQNTSSSHSSKPQHNLLNHHMQHNLHKATISPTISSLQVSETATNHFKSLLQSHKGDINGAFNSLWQQIKNLDNLSIESLIKKIIAFISNELLTVTNLLLDAFLDILIEVGTHLIQSLDTPIEIPIISDILKKIGIPSFSIFELGCYVCALPTTIMFKIENNRAPFPSNSHTNSLISASDFNTLSSHFPNRAPIPTMPQEQFQATENITIPNFVPSSDEKDFYVSCYKGASYIAIPQTIAQCTNLLMNKSNSFGTFNTVLSLISPALRFMADMYIPTYPIQNSTFSSIHYASFAICNGMKVYNFLCKLKPSAQLSFGITGNDSSRKISSFISALFLAPNIACSIVHITELIERSLSSQANKDHLTSAYLGVVGEFLSEVNTASYIIGIWNRDVVEYSIVVCGASTLIGGLLYYIKAEIR